MTKYVVPKHDPVAHLYPEEDLIRLGIIESPNDRKKESPMWIFWVFFFSLLLLLFVWLIYQAWKKYSEKNFEKEKEL